MPQEKKTVIGVPEPNLPFSALPPIEQQGVLNFLADALREALSDEYAIEEEDYERAARAIVKALDALD